ncbi:MAG TPA: hypothetical protein DIC52_13205 [Candidatus Latescibacteria bacterium]|jgi:hypothetical protein|nr:hypothetical protein [Candidatus Latescibacterota bacterium]
MTAFTVGGEAVGLPEGAFAHSRRIDVRWQDRHVFSFSQGPWRACLYPVYTPSGIAVTSESPVDHPHHNSIWIAADRVAALLPFADGCRESALYNFYVNDTFQGRTPGRIVAVDLRHDEIDAQHLRLTQQLQWRGPTEWGAPDGRLIARERRIVDLRCTEACYVIDLCSQLSATDWELTVGPTRHAYHGVRVIESLRQSHGGVVCDSNGSQGAATVSGSVSDWVDMSGPVGGGRTAGIALMPHADCAGHEWFVTDWGTMTVNPFAGSRRDIPMGQSLHLGARIVVHDGEAKPEMLTDLQARMATDTLQ